MISRTKLNLSRLCITGAWFFLLTSGMILCACPRWSAMGVGLALAAMWLRRGGEQLTPFLALVGCLFMTGVHLWDQFEMPGSRSARDHKTRDRVLRLWKERQAAESAAAATNQTAPVISK